MTALGVAFGLMSAFFMGRALRGCRFGVLSPDHNVVLLRHHTVEHYGQQGVGGEHQLYPGGDPSLHPDG